MLNWLKKIKDRRCCSQAGIFKWESESYFVFKMKTGGNVEVLGIKTHCSMQDKEIIGRNPIWTGENIHFLRSGNGFQPHS